MLNISKHIRIPAGEIEISAIRAQGSGGQNVNKVATAVHLRFNISASSLPDPYKERLLRLNDTRISKEGIINIKAQEYKSQKKNREMALLRLSEIIKRVIAKRKKRIPTAPAPGAVQKRLDRKARRGKIKETRKRITY